jgi:hypothetical protein
VTKNKPDRPPEKYWFPNFLRNQIYAFNKNKLNRLLRYMLGWWWTRQVTGLRKIALTFLNVLQNTLLKLQSVYAKKRLIH